MITYKVTVSKDATRWYLDGKLHRLDGPAVEWADGTKLWYLNNKLHRSDGPAIEYANGSKSWYLNGKRHRLDGPAVDCTDGSSKLWYLNGKCHRVGGPAVELTDGYKAWYLDGKMHRVDGPARGRADGSNEWYLNGKELTEKEHAKQTRGCAGKQRDKVKVTIILSADTDPSELLDWFEHVLTYDIGDFELDPDAVEAGEAITVEAYDV